MLLILLYQVSATYDISCVSILLHLHILQITDTE